MAHFKNILLVDDDPINNLINQRLISKVELGEMTHEFLAGMSALEFLQKLDPSEKSLILLDINMPVMNGWEFLDNYLDRFSNRNDIILILSSSIDFLDRIKAQEYSIVSGFLEKPLTIEKLTEHIDSL
ncbi:response regulator [Algoriphagus sediminis]|uniref:Response regulator n=1 Tax=Algoriphagus sediminis TaxID=3057113 RepID=A0ABT7Y7Q0_9BACT|nr:response regulator [Algoriphagus sediminis]MDN3202548.1 response regulator [Algoriphagus sediminis]